MGGHSMNKAIGYVRVSTAEQANEGVSMEAQRAKIQAWCDANGYELAAVYTDAGISGKRADNRPELQRALKAASRGSALVVYSLSRLSRSIKDAIDVEAGLVKRGSILVSLSEQLDTTTASGRLSFHIYCSIAQHEREVIGERTKLALAHIRANGQKTGGCVPFGYELAADGKTLTPNEAEQEAVAIIRELRASGLSYRAIANELNARELSTKQGATWKPIQVSRALKQAA